MKITVSGLSHRYGRREALRELSIELPAGGCHALVGRNGSGKTTLLKILATLIRPQTGEVSVLGHRLPDEAGALRRRTSVVFQSPAVDEVLSVTENLRCHAAMYGLSAGAAAAPIEAALASAGLTERRHEQVKKLSGGLKRRVELAKALLCEPELLLMDEPTTGLDAEARSAFWQHIAAARSQRKMTVLFTTHLLDEIDACDQVCLMDDGRAAFCGTPASLHSQAASRVIRLRSDQAEAIAQWLSSHHGLTPVVKGRDVEVLSDDAPAVFRGVLEAFGAVVQSGGISPPDLSAVIRLVRSTAPAEAATGA